MKEELIMTVENKTNQLTSKVEGNVLVLERTFNAPRELVFKAFSEEEHLKRWWAPGGWTMSIKQFEFRPEGVWHYCMKCTDESQEYFGHESWGRAVFHEIVAPEKIKSVDAFSDAEGNVSEELPQTKVTLTFVSEGNQTKLINRAEYASADDVKTVLDMGMLEGVTMTWNQLEELLAEMK